MATRTYDPAEILCSFLGNPITAWGPDTFIAATRNEDGWTVTVGAGGEEARTRNRNRSGKVTITLLASSPENDILSAAAELDEQSGEGVGPLFIKDRLGTSLVHAENAWIMKKPDLGRAKALGVVEWVIETGRLETFAGGSLLPA
jgi:hypothetical protein